MTDTPTRTHITRVDVPQIEGLSLSSEQRTLLSEVSSALGQAPEVILSELVGSALIALHRLLVKSAMREDSDPDNQDEDGEP